MWIYWFMFFTPASASFYISKTKKKLADSMLGLICAMFIFLIGFRFQVGGDWGAYLNYYEEIALFRYSFYDNLLEWDPGYVLVEYLSAIFGAGIYGVNLICGAILMGGVYSFCRRQPLPFLALSVATPYLIIIVAMGYTRQSVALGFELLALTALIENNLRKFIVFVVFASLFHKSGVLTFALGILAQKNKSFGNVIVVLIIAGLVSWKVLNETSDALWTNYVEQQMVSEGTLIRVVMNAVPATIFLVFAKHLASNETERRLWRWIATFSLLCIPFIYFASTATDRIALYFLPIQPMVYSRMPYLFDSLTFRFLTISTIIIAYIGVLFVLLNYGAVVSQFWVPYNNAVLV